MLKAGVVKQILHKQLSEKTSKVLAIAEKYRQWVKIPIYL